VFKLLLTLALALPLQGGERFPPGFAKWLLAYRGEIHLVEFMQHELLLAAGENEGLVPDPSAVEQALLEQIARRIENAHAGDREAWLLELKRLGLDDESWRNEHRAKTMNTLLIDRLVRARREISESKVVAAWERRHGPGGRATTVRWIQLAIRPPTPPPGVTRDEERALRDAAREATRARAEEIGAAWRAGAEFTALRRSAGSGDEPDEPFRLDELVLPGSVRQSVTNLAIGDISSPLAARGGWSLFKVVEAAHTPLERVREELVSDLAAQPANNAETTALLAELTTLEAPGPALSRAAFETDPLSSTIIIGRVGERPVRLDQFVHWLLETRGRPHLDTFRQVLLVERSARALGANFSPEEINARRESALRDRLDLFYEGDRVRWLEELTTSGRTFSGWRREADLRAHHHLCAETLLLARRVVSAEEVRAEWERRHGPDGYARSVRWILLTPPQPPDELGAAGLQEWLDEVLDSLHLRASELRRRVVEDGEDFGVLARRHSTDPGTRAEGGLIPGVFDPRQQSKAIANAVEPLKTGGVSQPVRLLVGYCIYQVQKIEHTPLEEVRTELRAALMTRRPSAVELASFVNQFFEESKN